MDDNGGDEAGRARLASAWEKRGAEAWGASLVPLRAKGAWPALAPVEGSDLAGPHEYVAALTFGKVKARRMVDFYLRGFPATAKRAVAPESGMVAGIGFAGGVPVRDPCTFSFWRADADVSRFAYASTSPHGDVQRRANQEGWFLESAFARFAVVDHRGSWAGSDPLTSTRRLSLLSEEGVLR